MGLAPFVDDTDVAIVDARQTGEAGAAAFIEKEVVGGGPCDPHEFAPAQAINSETGFASGRIGTGRCCWS